MRSFISILVIATVLVSLKIVHLLGLYHFDFYLTDTHIYKAMTDVPRLKILLATTQIVGSITWTTTVHWPEPFSSFVGLSDFVQFDLVKLIPINCMGQYSFLSHLVSATLVPLGIVCALLLWAIKPSIIPGQKVDESRRRKVWESNVYKALIVAFVVLPPTSLTLFRMFDCEDFEDGSYLAADLSVNCNSAVYKGHLVYAAMMLFVYPLGIPFGFFTIIYTLRGDIQSRDIEAPLPRKIRMYRPLFSDYHPSMCFGEVYRSGMRVILSGFAVVLAKRPILRASWGCFLAYLFVIIAREYQAFNKPSNNILSLVAQYQIFFSYLYAFYLLDKPFAVSYTTIGTTLLLVNLMDWVFAGARCFYEGDRRIKLFKHEAEALRLAKEVEGLRLTMLNVYTISRPVLVEDVDRFVHGDWSSKTSYEEAKLLGRVADLDSVSLEKGDEQHLEKFLAFVADQKYRSVKIEWSWKEDDEKRLWHDPKSVRHGCWVKYADPIAAQLEFAMKEVKGSAWTQATPSFVEIDVSGTQHGPNGTIYRVDLNRMVQVNVETKTERAVRRKEFPINKTTTLDELKGPKMSTDSMQRTERVREVKEFLAKKGIVADTEFQAAKAVFTGEDLPLSTFKPGALVTINVGHAVGTTGEVVSVVPPKFGKKGKVTVRLSDSKLRKFLPSELSVGGIDQGSQIVLSQKGATKVLDEDVPIFPTDLKTSRAPLLTATKGSQVQIHSKRPDGWWYGTVVRSSDERKPSDELVKNMTRIENLLSKVRSQLHPSREEAGHLIHAKANKEMKKNGTVWPEDGELNHLEEKMDKEVKDDENESLANCSAGWIPMNFLANPFPSQLAEIQAIIGGAAVTSEILQPPSHWETKSIEDLFQSRLFQAQGEERANAEKFLRESLAPETQIRRIVSVKRVENLSLWQSYMIKRQSLYLRGRTEGLGDDSLAQYERVWLFHDVIPDTIPKICTTGFNRSHCGRNAVAFGKGVYFTTKCQHGQPHAFAGEADLKFTFLCRVAIGEFCQGHYAQSAPDERNICTGQLYDSTVNSMDEAREVFVIYKDSQAYPEYLIEYELDTAAS